MDQNATLNHYLSSCATPLESYGDLGPLLRRTEPSRHVLVGESTHGTSEFYRWRIELTKRLIMEQGYSFVAVEGDWPDCYRLNRFVKGHEGASAAEALRQFRRWPTWMWANEETADFLEWLRLYNTGRADGDKIGFYGLDLYSLWDSLRIVTDYASGLGPEAARAAQEAFGCFEPHSNNLLNYAWLATLAAHNCSAAISKLIQEAHRQRAIDFKDDGDRAFDLHQNALVVKQADEFYKAMIRSDRKSWNIRDNHMAETYKRLLTLHGAESKGIVWAHNTHIGDARATDMVQEGTVNLGQLVREQHGQDNVVLVGFDTHMGSVIASPNWEAPSEMIRVPPSRLGSWGDVLHELQMPKALFIFDSPSPSIILGQRAIGVVYHPEREEGNYVPTNVPSRYDALIYLDLTVALHPLAVVAEKEPDAPETYPAGT